MQAAIRSGIGTNCWHPSLRPAQGIGHPSRSKQGLDQSTPPCVAHHWLQLPTPTWQRQGLLCGVVTMR